MTTQRLIELLGSQATLIGERYSGYHSDLRSLIIESIELQGEENSGKRRAEKIRTLIEKKLDVTE